MRSNKGAVQIVIATLLVLLASPLPYRRDLAATMRRAAAHRAAGEYAAALEYYRLAAGLEPGWSRPWQERGEVLLAQHRFAEAAPAFQEARERGAALPALLGLGDSLAGQGDWAGALQVWLQAQAVDPRDPRVSCVLAQGSVAQGRWERAAGYAALALAQDPAPQVAAAARTVLGRLLAGDDPAQAERLLRAAGDEDMLAVLAAAQEEADPTDRDLLLGAAFLQRGELMLARRHFERAAAGSPADDEAQAYLAHVLDRLGETVAAGRLLEQALAREPDSALVFYFLGSHGRRVGDPRQAQAALWQALQREPDNPAFHVEMAESFVDQGNYAQAEEWYRAAADVAPDDADFQVLLAQFYVDHLYLVEEAGLPAAQAAAALLPGDARVQDLLGWAYLLAGQPAEAEEALRLALELDPGLASAHLHLGSLYLQAGPAQRSQARLHLQRAADLDTGGYCRVRAESLLAHD